MTGPTIVVTVAPDGSVTAETVGVLGPACLDTLSMLEDLLDAEAVSSAFTADYHRCTSTTDQDVPLRVEE